MKAAAGTVLYSHQDIQRRIAELGKQISSDYAGRELTVIGILKGSFVFVADLVRQINSEIPVEVDFMSVSSYGDSTSSSGTIRVEKDAEVEIAGRDIIIVEDIVDTGLTLRHVYNILSERGANTLRVATLLEKPGQRQYPRQLEYVGFQIPNHFVVGYGLDYAQRYRNLPEIRILDEI
jgi:hypoxanthine phosphoribosyltransferase